MERILWVQHTAEARMAQLRRGAGKITTYRKGTKWLRPELVGQEVELVNCSAYHFPPCTDACEVFATARVLSVKACQYKDIGEIDHSRQSGDMTPEARLNIMKSVYKGEYDENTLTTVITLEVLGYVYRQH